jgi:hypothetical protein
LKRTNRILFGIGFFALLLVSWVVVASAKSNSIKQLELIENAVKLIDDGIYIRALPLLEEAVAYNAEHTLTAETQLKKVYLALINKRGYRRKYTELLENQMGRKNASPDIFSETADYYLGISKIPEAITALKDGVDKTGSPELESFYESIRYTYEIGRDVYAYASAIHGSTVRVLAEEKWGIARSNGNILIPCEYDAISTFSGDRAIVENDGEIFAVDRNNYRVAKLHESVSGFGNYADNRVALHFDDGWRRATGDFVVGSAAFEQIGMYSGGYAPAMENGRWGVIDLATKWLVPAQFDEIIQDELGRCHARGAVFARSGGAVYLFVDGRQVGDTYDDAHPFSSEGFAAVKKNGKWGFIDIDGSVALDFVFEDALSYGQHLAAVKQNGLWGYIDKNGKTVIDPEFIEAKSFSNGSAPILTDRGWRFITLLEYKSSNSLSLLG